MGTIALGPQAKPRTASNTVAYFCLEYAIEDNLPIYAGGLGVLAGDLVLEAGRQGLGFVAIGLFYSHGFGEEQALDPTKGGFILEPVTVAVEVGSEEVTVKVWSKKYGSATIFLLDAGGMTKYLYGPDQAAMFKQQIILGVGGVRLLHKLNLEPLVYHLNEGHTTMAIIELARENNWDYPKVGQSVVATKHTIFTGAGLHLKMEELYSGLKLYAERYNFDVSRLFALGTHPKHPGSFSTTNFLLKFTHRQSGVSHLHTVMEKTVHPESTLIPITNGVNITHWDQFASRQHNQVLTIIWARRFASYKRPDLLFSDLNRLKRIVNQQQYPVRFVVAGKTNPTDQSGKELEDKIKTLITSAGLEQQITLITDYSLPVAKKLVASADVWLNTPISGQEACGTSGMKAGLNGALMLSTNDGWMAEVNWAGLGWILPEENITEVLYRSLETEIAPMYYTNQKEWQSRSLRTRSLILDYFNTKRVLEDYQTKLYS